MQLRILGSPPATQELADALMAASRALGKDMCYAHCGRFHFTVGAGWSIALSSDSAERIRVEGCRLSTPKTTMWALAGRHDRIERLVLKMLNSVAEPV